MGLEWEWRLGLAAGFVVCSVSITRTAVSYTSSTPPAQSDN